MPPPPDSHRPILLVWAAAYVVHLIMTAANLAASPIIDRIPYHTSALSGHAWILLAILGLHKHVVHALVATLWAPDLQDSCYIMFKKKLAMFLYMSVTSLRIHHMREHFQHSNETISQ